VGARNEPRAVRFTALPELDANAPFAGGEHPDEERDLGILGALRHVDVGELELYEAPRRASVDLDARIDFDDRRRRPCDGESGNE
jgi:hypothetical protein